METDISWTYDVPPLNEGGKIDVLDLKMWSHDDVIFFEFYEKGMASLFFNLRNSALSWHTKEKTLAGEVCSLKGRKSITKEKKNILNVVQINQL